MWDALPDWGLLPIVQLIAAITLVVELQDLLHFESARHRLFPASRVEPLMVNVGCLFCYPGQLCLSCSQEYHHAHPACIN